MMDNYEPGSLGFHELVDRSCLIATMFEDFVAEHPAAKHPALQKQITHIEKALYDLYQEAERLNV